MKYAKGQEVDPILLSSTQAARVAGEDDKEWERVADTSLCDPVKVSFEKKTTIVDPGQRVAQ